MWIQAWYLNDPLLLGLGTGCWERAIVLTPDRGSEEAWRVPTGSLTHRWMGDIIPTDHGVLVLRRAEPIMA